MKRALTGVTTVALLALLSAVVYAAVAPSGDASLGGGTTTIDDVDDP